MIFFLLKMQSLAIFSPGKVIFFIKQLGCFCLSFTYRAIELLWQASILYKKYTFTKTVTGHLKSNYFAVRFYLFKYFLIRISSLGLIAITILV